MSTLPPGIKEDWIKFDEAIIKASRERIRAWGGHALTPLNLPVIGQTFPSDGRVDSVGEPVFSYTKLLEQHPELKDSYTIKGFVSWLATPLKKLIKWLA